MIDKKTKEVESKERFKFFSFTFTMIIFILIVRAGYLQLYEGDHYVDLSDNNRLRTNVLRAPRGDFYDRNGLFLVTNHPNFNVNLLPYNTPIDPDEIVRLSKLLNISIDEIQQKISNHYGLEPIKISSNVTQDIVTIIEEQKFLFRDVVIEVQPSRIYYLGEKGAHIFGYTGEISEYELENKKDYGYNLGDVIGKYGLELFYDKEIRGENGGEQIEVDVNGNPLHGIARKNPKSGCDLILTIDHDLQVAADQAVDEVLNQLGCHAAAAVVLNPQTGEVLALVSRPTFEPNSFTNGISSKLWDTINQNPDHPLDNKAITGEYPPGSTFKIVTGTAALQSGKVTPSEQILDTGTHWLVPKGNAGGEALGWIDFNAALSHSDNVYFYEMGHRLGADLLENYARMFGLGKVTGIDLPYESTGLVNWKEYKWDVYHEDFYLSEIMDVAIGQGFNLVTPLQAAMIISEIAANGKIYKPHLVKQIITKDKNIIRDIQPELVGELQVDPWVIKEVQAGLHDVTKSGTAASNFINFPYDIAGKTGTAENSQGRDHGWFVGYGPFENPTIAVAVIVEQGGYGSTSATPIARKIMEKAFELQIQRGEIMSP